MYEILNSNFFVVFIGIASSLVVNFITFKVIIAEMGIKITVLSANIESFRGDLKAHVHDKHDKDSYIHETLSVLKFTVESQQHALQDNTKAINELSKTLTKLDIFFENINKK